MNTTPLTPARNLIRRLLTLLAGTLLLASLAGPASAAPATDIRVTFRCTGIDVTADKDLSNVVLQYADGVQQKFDDLNRGPSGTFAGTEGNNGKIVRVAWIKAGNNHSGDGPGFGERFNSTQSCTAGPTEPEEPAGDDADEADDADEGDDADDADEGDDADDADEGDDDADEGDDSDDGDDDAVDADAGDDSDGSDEGDDGDAGTDVDDVAVGSDTGTVTPAPAPTTAATTNPAPTAPTADPAPVTVEADNTEASVPTQVLGLKVENSPVAGSSDGSSAAVVAGVSGDSLPRTGVPAPILALVALGALVLGGGVLQGARR